jgi:gag-polypeptide of LTR copia-type
MQSLTDRLRSVGSMISDQDLVIYTLQGLNSEYEVFVTAFSMRQDSPSMFDLHRLLLAHEARIQVNLKSLSSTFAHMLSANQIVSDNTGSRQSEVLYTSDNSIRGPNSYSFTKNQSGQYHRGRDHGYNRSRGRGRQQYQSNDTLAYRICSRWGHYAANCYHRFDIRHSDNVLQIMSLQAMPLLSIRLLWLNHQIPTPTLHLLPGFLTHVLQLMSLMI